MQFASQNRTQATLRDPLAVTSAPSRAKNYYLQEMALFSSCLGDGTKTSLITWTELLPLDALWPSDHISKYLLWQLCHLKDLCGLFEYRAILMPTVCHIIRAVYYFVTTLRSYPQAHSYYDNIRRSLLTPNFHI